MGNWPTCLRLQEGRRSAMRVILLKRKSGLEVNRTEPTEDCTQWKKLSATTTGHLPQLGELETHQTQQSMNAILAKG